MSSLPALAMESTTFAGDSPETEPVVSVRVDDSDPKDGVCTGTAIAEHWVITARHCTDMARKPGGSVRTGQGDSQAVYQVDRVEVAPRGDIALMHTVEPMRLSHFAEVAAEAPSGEVNIYGWSSDGSGGSTQLPSAKGKVEGESELSLYDAPVAAKVTLADGARIQPGDSGGAIFADGKVAGIMSAGLFEDPDNPTEEEMQSNSAVAVAPVADQAEWIRSVAGEQEPESTAAGGNAPSAGAASGGSTEWLRYAALGLGVLALLAAGFWALRRH
ncbi:putative peptidase precursor [Corynebacterium glaucum]|nr:putative peptidase precursor [Corynebacterium glaucum]